MPKWIQMPKLNEAELDIAIANLVSLKDGQQDELAKLLDPAISALKKCRTERMRWKETAKQIKNAENLIKDMKKTFGGKK